MLVPQKAQLWRMVQYIGLPLLLLLLWDFAIVAAFKLLHWEWVGTKNLPLALYGSAIGILVGFRNNSAYAPNRQQQPQSRAPSRFYAPPSSTRRLR